MKTKTVKEFLKRGGKIKQVDFTKAYEKQKFYLGKAKKPADLKAEKKEIGK